MSLSLRFGTVGKPISTPKKPGGSVGAVHASLHTLEQYLLEAGWENLSELPRVEEDNTWGAS